MKRSRIKTKTVRTIALIADILEMSAFTVHLLDTEKNYFKLLKFLLENKELAKNLRLKDFQSHFNLPYEHIRKQVNDLYDDLINYGKKEGWEIRDKVYAFNLKSSAGHASFTLNTIPHVPRVGENVQLSFFHEALGGSNYYVESINYVITDKKQIVQIELIKGWHNLYWELRKAEAEATGEFTLDDTFHLDDYQKKRKLGFGGF